VQRASVLSASVLSVSALSRHMSTCRAVRTTEHSGPVKIDADLWFTGEPKLGVDLKS
jgi:hypothetical protein